MTDYPILALEVTTINNVCHQTSPWANDIGVEMYLCALVQHPPNVARNRQRPDARPSPGDKSPG